MGMRTINGSSAIRGIRPLSNFWTYFRVASQSKILTNTNDNEEVSDDNVRYHINSCVSYISDLLLLASSPWYGCVLTGALESALHSSGLPYMDLSGIVNPTQDIDVSRILQKIERINVPVVAGGASTQFKGNCVNWDVTKLTQQANNMNNQHSQTIAWNHYGQYLFFFIGNDIASPATSSGTAYTLPSLFTVFAYRQPLLDDLLPPVNSVTYVQRNATQSASSAVVSEYVDLPDRYIKLLVDMVQALILQQLQRPIPNRIEQDVNQGIMQLTQLISEEKRNAAEDRMKASYGQQKFPFYAGAPGQG